MAPRKKEHMSKDDNKRSNFIAHNLRYLRSNKGSTLEDVRRYLGLSGKSSYRAYEQGDAVPSIHILMKLASYFDVSLDELVRVNLLKESTNATDKKLVVPEVPVVGVKARAGYISGFHDDTFIDNLETIKIPYKPYGVARAFQIDGDSMEPEVSDGSYVVGIKVDRNGIQSGKNYIIITGDGDVVYKMVMISGDKLNLISRNPKYPPIVLEGKNVKEMWRYFCHINKVVQNEV